MDGRWTIHICLYGGEDVEWIRQFTTTAKAVAQAAKVQLEMLYVGKSNPREKILKINNLLKAENLSHILPDSTLIWFFWVRLESMRHSEVQLRKSKVDDPIMQEIMTMLSFDESEQGWAVICRGSTEMARGKADTIFKSLTEFEKWRDLVPEKGFVPALNDYFKSLTEFEKWRDLVPEKGFVPALNDYLHELHTPHHCNRLILPGATGSIPEKVVCSECGKAMEKFIMFECVF